MSAIIKLDAIDYIHKAYTYKGIGDKQDEIRSLNFHTITLTTKLEAENIANFINSRRKINMQSSSIRFNGYSTYFNITYKIITENIEPIIQMFDLNEDPFLVGINLYDMIKGELQVIEVKRKIQDLKNLENSKFIFYLNYLIKLVDQLYIERDDHYTGDDISYIDDYLLKFIEYCIECLWKYINLEKVIIHEKGLKNLISEYIGFMSEEFINLNGEKFKVSFIPLFEDSVFIEESILKLVFNDENVNKINGKIFKNNYHGVFISRVQWKKYELYEKQWNESFINKSDEYMKINDMKYINYY